MADLKFVNFLQWEAATRDTIDFKKIYVDIAGDFIAGALLSEIIYWYLPDKNGKANKLRVFKEQEFWIAVCRHEWWDRVRLSPREADRAINLLVKNELLTKKVFKFKGNPTTHIRLNEEMFLKKYQSLIENPTTNPYTPKVENRSNESVKTESQERENEITDLLQPLTKNTTENTALNGADTPIEELSLNEINIEAKEKVEEDEFFNSTSKKKSKNGAPKKLPVWWDYLIALVEVFGVKEQWEMSNKWNKTLWGHYWAAAKELYAFDYKDEKLPMEIVERTYTLCVKKKRFTNLSPTGLIKYLPDGIAEYEAVQRLRKRALNSNTDNNVVDEKPTTIVDKFLLEALKNRSN